jgi:hypothetical protein
MFLKGKKRISELLDTVSEYLGVFCQLRDPAIAISDCLAAIDGILSQLDLEETVPQKTIKQLRSVKQSFNVFLTEITQINEESVKLLNEKVLLLKAIFQEEVKGKLNVVFFPYKASMWDSLATVYGAAAKDDDCVAHVVPIPYYELSQNGSIPMYEGDRFPENIPITHYNQYNLEEEQPDMIFVHNIYDKYNTLTRVHEQYFTSNLKKYTDMLVYVPYHVSSFIQSNENGDRSYNLPSIKYVDKIILVGEFLKKAAIDDGIPSEKLLVLGSPKLDALVNAMKEDIPYPVEWIERLKKKTVYLVNTGCLFFADQPNFKIEKMMDFFNIPRIVEDSIIIWRPHPLTKISIIKYVPQLLDYYLNLTEKYIKGGNKFYRHIILDETDNYLPALMAADVLISSEGSLLRSYLLTEKKVLFWDNQMPMKSLLPPNVFYYAFNQSEPWYELVKKFSTGYDPLVENRKGMAAKVYANTDGSSGEKVYQSIKECVLKKVLNY